MQALITSKVYEDAQKNAILDAVSDRYCRAILEATMEMPMPAMKISVETGIPISTVYRRLQALHDDKLLRITGSISDDGKKYFLYKSRVRAITSTFDGGRLEVEITPNMS